MKLGENSEIESPRVFLESLDAETLKVMMLNFLDCEDTENIAYEETTESRLVEFIKEDLRRGAE